MNHDMRKDHFFEMSFYVGSDDFENIQQVVNQGIDSRLAGFTKSEFKYSNNRLFCWIHPAELEIVIRRLLELENDDAELLADDIVLIQYGYEIV